MPHPPPIQEVGGAWPCEDGTCWTRRGQTWLTWWPGPGKVEAVSSGALTGRGGDSQQRRSAPDSVWTGVRLP